MGTHKICLVAKHKTKYSKYIFFLSGVVVENSFVYSFYETKYVFYINSAAQSAILRTEFMFTVTLWR